MYPSFPKWSQCLLFPQVQSTEQCLASSKILTPHPPPHPASVSSPPHQRRGEDTLAHARRWPGGGSIFWKTPYIGLASYSIISLRLFPSAWWSPRHVLYSTSFGGVEGIFWWDFLNLSGESGPAGQFYLSTHIRTNPAQPLFVLHTITLYALGEKCQSLGVFILLLKGQCHINGWTEISINRDGSAYEPI